MDYGIWVVIIILTVVVLAAYWGLKELFGDNYIRCPNCEYVGKKAHGTSGSISIEIVLYIFGIIGLFFFLVPGIIILMIAVIYGLSRKHYIKCPMCDWKHPVKMDYDAYKKILALREKGPKNQPAV